MSPDDQISNAGKRDQDQVASIRRDAGDDPDEGENVG
jgi:hypothetical protein